MAKARNTAFFCKECGYESAKWLGQCPVCKEWNTFVEEPVAQTKKAPTGQINAVGAGKTAVPVHISEISLEEQDRTPTGFGELDRVLGSGIVKGSLVLVGGDPGIGKSTLLLQVCRNLAGAGKRALYISGEESLKQIKMRANRIGEISGDLLFLCETNLDTIHSAIERANNALWAACNEKARLVALYGASDKTLRAVRAAGYCPIDFDLDYSGGLPTAAQAASSIARQARSGGCIAYLGADTAVQADWSALLSRLRSSSRLITALNELAVIKDA